MLWSTDEFIWNPTANSAGSIVEELLCLRSLSQNRTPLVLQPQAVMFEALSLVVAMAGLRLVASAPV
jgi:hypothetical protein